MPLMSSKDAPVLHTRLMAMSAAAKNGTRVNSYDPKTRTAEVMISTGMAVRRRDAWSGEEWDEKLDITPKSVRLGRLNIGAPLVDSHNYDSGIDAMLGAIMPGTARIENGQLIATVKLSRTEKGDRIARDLEDGIPISVSTGYKTYSEKRDPGFTPEIRLATDWEPFEVSVVPIPAEPGAAFRQFQRTALSLNEGNSHMTEAEKKRAAEEAAALKLRQDEETEEDKKKKKEEEDAAAAAAAEERKAAEELRTRAPAHAPAPANYAKEILTIGREAGMSLELIEAAVSRNDTPEVFTRAALSHLASKSNGSTSGVNITVVRDENEGRMEAMEEAMVTRILSARRTPAVINQEQAEWAKRNGKLDLVARSFLVYDGHEKPQRERAKQYLGSSFIDLAAECIGHRGNIRNQRDSWDVFTRAMHTTSDFPTLFENAMNKSLLARYQLAAPTYRQLAQERTFQDFRPHPQYRAGDFPTLLEIEEGGEIKDGTTTEGKETVQVKPYGRIFSISRQAIVNDDMGAIDQMLGSAGQMVLVFENNAFFAMMLTANGAGPTLATDSLPVWSTSHVPSNRTTSGSTPPTVDSISLGRQAMRNMTSPGGSYLNVPPAIILTGPAQETKADQVVSSITPALVGSVNPFSGKLRSISDAHITGTQWYLFAEPSQVPNFVYGFLSGGYGPRIRNDEPFGIQGVRMSLEHDFGCGAIDWRGTYQNNGAS